MLATARRIRSREPVQHCCMRELGSSEQEPGKKEVLCTGGCISAISVSGVRRNKVTCKCHWREGSEHSEEISGHCCRGGLAFYGNTVCTWSYSCPMGSVVHVLLETSQVGYQQSCFPFSLGEYCVCVRFQIIIGAIHRVFIFTGLGNLCH